MNTSLCAICSQSVPLDDSGRLEEHRRQVPTTSQEPKELSKTQTCPGSGTTPQAPDGADKAETPLIVQRCAQAICNSFATIFAEQGIAYKFDASKTTIEEWICKCVAAEVADLESRLAMAEDAAAKGNKARELAGAMKACIQEQDEKISGLVKALADLFAMMGIERDGEEGWAVQIVLFAIRLKAAKSALDAARDKKGTE